jgi:hypothetical protein
VRRVVVVLLVIALGLALGTGVSLASPLPPPPPPPPTLIPPPAPPTPVPTVAPTVVAPQPVVDVHLEASKVTRGQTQKLDVAASTDDVVMVTIQYKSGKPLIYRAKVGSTGKLSKTWKVPKSAPVGKATVKVVVDSGGTTVSKNFSFQVTK